MSPPDSGVAPTPADTATLCVFLIKNRPRIERELGHDGYGQFCDAIDGWQDKHLRNPKWNALGRAIEAAVQDLYGICARFGVIDLMESKGPKGSRAVRTRGSAARPARGSGTGFGTEALRERLEEVGRLFGRV